MVFMVTERFLSGQPDEVGARFRNCGRMLPTEVRYMSSWMIADGTGCYQLMEAETAEALKPWLEAWSDLVDFEVIPVKTSDDFWHKREQE